jgi:uncharacterized membrane protein
MKNLHYLDKSVFHPLQLRGGLTGNSVLQISPHDFFEIAADVINSTGGLLLVLSCLSAIVNTVHLWFNKGRDVKLLIGDGKSSLDSIRLSLGEMITFALELLVAADVIDTLTKPAHDFKMESLYKIAIIVIIRTTLSYFLGKVGINSMTHSSVSME